jgi:uncharacterized protein (DUF952 family)
MPNNILHLVPADSFRRLPEDAPYLPEDFARDGFIHPGLLGRAGCTREPEVLLAIANTLFKETPGEMLVLVIDADRVHAPVKLEPPIPAPDPSHPLAGHLFPHIYGPLDREAIVAVRPAQRGPDGTFLAV